MAGNVGKEYWATWYSYIKENIEVLTVKQIADHIKIGRRSLTTTIAKWREEGLLTASKEDWEAHKGYVEQYWSTYTLQEIADGLGVNKRSLRNHITRWNKEKSIKPRRKKERPKKEPKIRVRKTAEELKEYREQQRILRQQVREEKKIREEKEKADIARKRIQAAKEQRLQKHLQKLEEKKNKEVKKIPTRAVDMNQMKYVRINNSTTILVEKSISDTDAIANWKKKHNKV